MLKDNIKVGDYVRTENGIDKVMSYRYEPEYENGHVVWFKKSDSGCRFTDKDLPKSSPNIIDLIEVGDYVNECKIIDICINEITNLKYLETDITEFDNIYACGHINIYEKDIRSVVTKEQFESMEYKIEK